MTPITYGHVDKLLRSLGFTPKVAKQARWYEHQPTGAVIAYAELPLDQEILPPHLGAVRAVLKAYGLGGPGDLDDWLRRAG